MWAFEQYSIAEWSSNAKQHISLWTQANNTHMLLTNKKEVFAYLQLFIMKIEYSHSLLIVRPVNNKIQLTMS